MNGVLPADFKRACESDICENYEKAKQLGDCNDSTGSQEIAEADRGDSGMRLDRPDRYSDDSTKTAAPTTSARHSQKATQTPPALPTPTPIAQPKQYAEPNISPKGSKKPAEPTPSANNLEVVTAEKISGKVVDAFGLQTKDSLTFYLLVLDKKTDKNVDITCQYMKNCVIIFGGDESISVGDEVTIETKDGQMVIKKERPRTDRKP